MPDQLQLRGGTTAQHASFTGASKEVTVDTTKKTLVVHDGSTAGGNPLLREDQSNLPTTAPTRGIYNASGSLAISTNGAGRLFVDASGNVGIGTSSSGGVLRVFGATGKLIIGDSNFNYFDANTQIFRDSSANERMRLDSSGRLGVGTSNPGSLLHLASNSNSSTSFQLDNTSAGGYLWGLHSVGSSAGLGPVGSLAFRDSTNGATRLLIDSSGRVGIGTAAPSTILHVASSAPYIRIQDNDSSVASSAQGGFEMYDSDGDRLFFLANDSNSSADVSLFNNAGGALKFGTSGSERGQFDSSGRLLVGTSTGSERLRVAGQIQIGNGTSGGGGGGFVRTTQSTATGSSHTIAFADYAPNGSGDDFSGFMVITAQFTGYPGKTAVGTFAIGKNSAAGVSVAQLSNTKIGMTTFTVGTSGNDIAVTTDASCKVSCVFMGGQ